MKLEVIDLVPHLVGGHAMGVDGYLCGHLGKLSGVMDLRGVQTGVSEEEEGGDGKDMSRSVWRKPNV